MWVNKARTAFDGAVILIVEDDYFIAAAATCEMRGAGASVVGPARSVAAAMEILCEAPVDFAVVDISLVDGYAYPLLDDLRARGIPVLLATGMTRDMIPAPYRWLPMCSKPYTTKQMESAIAQR